MHFYQSRSIEAAQVMEELVQTVKKFREAAACGVRGRSPLLRCAGAERVSGARADRRDPEEDLAHELAENLRETVSVDWSARESVQAKLRLMVKRILGKCKYPPERQDAAVELVLQQAKALVEAWA